MWNVVGIRMLESVANVNKSVVFTAENPEQNKSVNQESRILPNNSRTRIRQNSQKISSAIIDYPVKGLKGDVNSNFYEFLTMGIIPYIAGSATLMFVFNAANKHLNLFSKDKASTYGKKMAMGVLLYGLFKNISKKAVTIPVRQATGIDTELPYENIVYKLPTEAGENANIEIQHQQRKVYDSKEFFRKDLLKKEYFDNAAKKLGLGDNLNDSVSEVTPIIQNVVATTNTAKSLSSYLWAAVGVGMAVQDCWKNFFNSISNRTRFVKDKNNGIIKNIVNKAKISSKNIWKASVSFVKTFLNSFIQMWKGNNGTTGFRKHAGKSFISLAILTTLISTLNVIIRAKKMAQNSNDNFIDMSKESTVI